jgi:hypothetical protein
VKHYPHQLLKGNFYKSKVYGWRLCILVQVFHLFTSITECGYFHCLTNLVQIRKLLGYTASENIYSKKNIFIVDKLWTTKFGVDVTILKTADDKSTTFIFWWIIIPKWYWVIALRNGSSQSD